MIDIREHRESDLPQLEALVAQLHEAARAADPHLPAADAIIDRYFTWLLGRVAGSGGAILVAEREGRLLGYMCVLGQGKRGESPQDPGGYIYISDLYVTPDAPEAREALLSEVERVTRERGVRRLHLSVRAGTEPDAEAYTRLGFRERMRVLTKDLEPGADDLVPQE